MKFVPKSAKRGETRVEVMPSSPDGYFYIDSDPFYPPYAVGSISLRDIKPRHVRALQRGDTSVMDRYVVTDTGRPGFVSFARCFPAIPDPLEPRGVIGVRETREVRLDRANRANDAHQAVGEWWSQRLLNPILDVGDGEVTRPDISEQKRLAVAQRAGDFALILADLSRNGGPARLAVDYYPDRTLTDAASLAFVPAAFSLKSYTEITDGVAMAREGRSGEVTQIWPPLPEPAPQRL